MNRNKEIFEFLSNLERNNNRDWFQGNKAYYDELRAAWVSDIERLLQKMSEYDESLRGVNVKDCIYRIYRDVRFSNDKSPYKTYFSTVLGRGGRKDKGSLYYLHMQPGASGLYGGLWCPQPDILNVLRREIDGNIEEFLKVIEDKKFSKFYNFAGESLKTMPKGYPREHPYGEYIKMKEYLLEHKCPDSYFTEGDWVEKAARDFRIMKPFHDFMNFAIEDMGLV